MLKKLKRTVTSILPVDEGRKGQCVGCGACCKLPVPCPFLKEEGGRCLCKIYKIRPLNCRKYPRSPSEHITPETCGFKFAKPAASK